MACINVPHRLKLKYFFPSNPMYGIPIGINWHQNGIKLAANHLGALNAD